MHLAFQLLIALLIAAVLWRAGMAAMRMLFSPPPPPPPVGELRRLSLRYRCSLCGAEAKIVLAATEEPEPPRHCMEDMDLVVKD